MSYEKKWVVWADETEPEVQFTPEQFCEHLKNVYGIDAKSTAGMKELILHLKRQDGPFYVYRWTIAGKKFTQTISYGKEKK